MGTTVSLNGKNYIIPAVGEGNWGVAVSNYLIALSTGVLSKAGGSFTLTADVDFGATYGIKATKFASRNTPSTTGVVRLGNNESLGWRNAANSADKLLKLNASNVLEFDGNPLVTLALGAANTVLRMNAGGTAYEFAKIANDNVDTSAAIAYSKLNLATSIVNGDISGSAAIAYSKLNLATSIVNGDISGSAAIAYSKLNLAGSIVSSDISGTISIAKGGTNSATALNNNRIMQSSTGAIVEAAAITASRALASDANGIPVASATTATELGYVNGVTSAIQTQFSGKASLSGDTFTGNVIVDNAKEIRFSELDANGSNYIGFKAPDSVTADKTFVLPDGDGSSNQVLKTDGAGNLGWATVAAGIGTNFDVYAVSSTNYTVLDNDGYRHIQVSTGASDRTITLPTAADNSDRMITISKTDSGIGDVIIDGEGAETIDGATTYTLTTQYQQLTIVCNGTSWSKVSGQMASASEYGLVKGGNVPGDTSGVAISTGYVGHKSAVNSAGVAPAAASGYKTIASVTLNKGVYLIYGVGVFSRGTMTGQVLTMVGIGTSADTQPGTESTQVVDGTNLGSVSYQSGMLYAVVASDSTTYYLNTRVDCSSVGTALWTSTSVINAIRIA